MKELKLIKDIKKRAGKPGKGVKLGIGDDCAVLECDKKNYLLWASDMLVEGTHFRLKDGYEKIGHKAVAVNISDIAAMGGKPLYITVSVGVSPKVSDRAVGKIYDGIFSICRKYGISLVGGDTVRAGRLTIDISIIGMVEKKYLKKRSDAAAGDLILLTGPVRNGKKEHLELLPRIGEARYLVENYGVGAMIDTSDGIGMDLGRICEASRTGCRVFAGAIPLAKGLSLKDALYYGESFELLFTMKKKEVEKLFLDKKLREKKYAFFIVGEICAAGEGRKIVHEGNRLEALKIEGYRHLQ